MSFNPRDGEMLTGDWCLKNVDTFKFTLEEIEQIAKHFNVAASKLLSPIFMSESREAALADGGEE